MRNPKGLSLRLNQRGQSILRAHYSADPHRTPEWAKEMRPRAKSDATWKQEQEIDYSAAGGERVLREKLLERWDKIVISRHGWHPGSTWRYGGGFDWGKTNPTAFVGMVKDESGCIYAVSEHYRSGLTPQDHAAILQQMRIPNPLNELWMARVAEEGVSCDPSIIGQKSQIRDNEFVSVGEMFAEAGIECFVPGTRGDDGSVVERILDMWSWDDPGFKIVCPQELRYDRKNPGTFHYGCPNLLWELLNLRREQAAAFRVEKANLPERLVDKDNHAWDALKYYISSRPESAKEDRYGKWMDRAKKMNAEKKDINTLIMAHHDFMKETAEPESVRWA